MISTRKFLKRAFDALDNAVAVQTRVFHSDIFPNEDSGEAYKRSFSLLTEDIRKTFNVSSWTAENMAAEEISWAYSKRKKLGYDASHEKALHDCLSERKIPHEPKLKFPQEERSL